MQLIDNIKWKRVNGCNLAVQDRFQYGYWNAAKNLCKNNRVYS